MLYLAGVGLSFFLFVLLLSKKGKTFADQILVVWIFFMTLHVLLYYTVKTETYPALLGMDIPLPLLHGPFLYLYTRALTGRPLTGMRMAIHFVPPLATAIYVIPFFIRPIPEKLYVYAHQGIGYETFGLIKTICIIISGVVYVVLSAIALRTHRAAIAERFSSTERISLDWLQYLIYWIAAIWILVIIGNDDLVYGAAVLFILFIGYFGIRQGGIFTSVALEFPKRANDSAGQAGEVSIKKKYLKSGLSEDHSGALHRRLHELMQTERLFCVGELSLADLAQRLDIPANHLSQVINEREGKTFYDYINTLRIEEFKRKAAGPDSRRYTLIALAQECGFNSKSSFNRYFKKVTGQSPSEFLESVQSSN